MRLGEFDIISTYFSNVGCWPSLSDTRDILKEIGDDCAVVSIPEGYKLCFSMDTLVSSVHFPDNIEPSKLASRALAIAISDLAAMGAIPWCFTLSLSLPKAEDQWLHSFSHQLNHDARNYQIRLVGGDMTRGPLSLTFQVHGLLTEGQGLYRHLAKPGDIVCVTGNLGDAAGALVFLDSFREGNQETNEAIQQLLKAYYAPTPQIGIGRAVANFASSAIDISDGFLADLQHINNASSVGAHINLDNIPISGALKTLLPEKAINLALQGGDDYQLIICVPPTQQHNIQPLGLIPVGDIRAEPGIFLHRSGVACEPVNIQGYQHF